MIKLKFNLDPADRNQMLALSRFAGTLAGAGVEIQTNKPEGVKLAAVTAEAEAAQEAPVKPEPKQEAAPAPTRKRRTKAEIEAAEKAAGLAPVEDDREHEFQPDETEDGELEAESEDAEETAPAGKSTAERGGKKITMDDVRAAVAEKKDKHFDKMKRELLNRYGVATTPKLPEEHWAAFYDFVNGLD